MTEKKNEKTVRRELAAALLLLLALAVPAVLIAGRRAWGRMEQAPEPGADSGQQGAKMPATARTWVDGLGPAERDWMMAAFLGALRARLGGGRPDVPSAPPLCRARLGAPLVVTVYGPDGRPAAHVQTSKPTLAESVQQAAAAAYVELVRRGRRINLKKLRVHISVLCASMPLDAEQRAAFVQRKFGEPVGLMLAGKEGVKMLMPVDAAASIDTTARATQAGAAAGLHGEMLALLCNQAGLQPGAWRRADKVPIWLLRVDGFVNEPGSPRAAAGARTLLRQGAPRADDLRHSLRLAMEYLDRSQSKDGAFTMIYASGLTMGCSSIVLQCQAAAAAARACGSLPDARTLLPVALRGVAFAIVNDTHGDASYSYAYTHRKESCREVFALEATAQALAALCRYTGAGGRRPVRNDIMSLAQFLLVMRDDAEAFHLRYKPETRRPWTPEKHRGAIVPRARAAYALCLASQTTQEPEFLLAARGGMDVLLQEASARVEALNSTEARWLAQAMHEHARQDPRRLDEYVRLLDRLARSRLARQMGPDDAPYWDVVGGSGRDYPPRSQRTAEDLIVMLTARDLGATVEGLDQGIERATRFLLRMQFTERNSYAYPDADRRIGAFRKQSDRKLVDLGGVSTAMEALALELELRDRETPKQ